MKSLQKLGFIVMAIGILSTEQANASVSFSQAAKISVGRYKLSYVEGNQRSEIEFDVVLSQSVKPVVKVLVRRATGTMRETRAGIISFTGVMRSDGPDTVPLMDISFATGSDEDAEGITLRFAIAQTTGKLYRTFIDAVGTFNDGPNGDAVIIRLSAAMAVQKPDGSWAQLPTVK